MNVRYCGINFRYLIGFKFFGGLVFDFGLGSLDLFGDDDDDSSGSGSGGKKMKIKWVIGFKMFSVVYVFIK